MSRTSPPSPKYQYASSLARLKSCWALTFWGEHDIYLDLGYIGHGLPALARVAACSCDLLPASHCYLAAALNRRGIIL